MEEHVLRTVVSDLGAECPVLPPNPVPRSYPGSGGLIFRSTGPTCPPPTHVTLLRSRPYRPPPASSLSDPVPPVYPCPGLTPRGDGTSLPWQFPPSSGDDPTGPMTRDGRVPDLRTVRSRLRASTVGRVDPDHGSSGRRRRSTSLHGWTVRQNPHSKQVKKPVQVRQSLGSGTTDGPPPA